MLDDSFYEPDWRSTYRERLISAAEAVGKFRSGMGIQMMDFDAQSPLIADPLVENRELEDLRLYLMFMRPDSAISQPERTAGRFEIYSQFLNEVSRPLVEQGHVGFIPSHNSYVNRQFLDGHIEVDAIVLGLTAPDRNGFYSMSFRPGLNKPMVHELKKRKGDGLLVIALVNDNLPFLCGDTLIHESEIDFLVDNVYPLEPAPWPTEAELGPEMPLIAENVATLIDDGATVEFGIGKIPPHVCGALKTKNDLGIHTEILSGPLFELIQLGVATGKYKTIHQYQAVFGVAMPNLMEMYEWMHRNPLCGAYPLNYVCDTSVIAQHDNFVAVNSAIQVDLTGQNNSEVVRNSQWSGSGGQHDYMKGAVLSKGGKAIIAIKSTAQDGAISRITGDPLYAGGVTTGRNDIQYVVTEYGVAKLEGRSLKQRAHALIDIAHPGFRDELAEKAKQRNIW